MLKFAFSQDAAIFYHVESWAPSTTIPHSTHYLGQIELFQRHLTTCAFRLAGGVESSSGLGNRPSKQNPIPQVFITKITRAFLDALYAILDGLVLLASDESPVVTGKLPPIDKSMQKSTTLLEVLDVRDSVSPRIPDSSSANVSFVEHSDPGRRLKLRAYGQHVHSKHAYPARECVRCIPIGGQTGEAPGWCLNLPRFS